MFNQLLGCLVAISVACSRPSTTFVQAEAQQSTTDLVSGSIQITKEVIPVINNLIV